MEYFKHFPLIEYNNEQTVNVLARIRLREYLKNNIYIYDKYQIKEGERPDILADNYYGDYKYTWLIFYANDIFDPTLEWPLSYYQFFDQLNHKYQEKMWLPNVSYIVGNKAQYGTKLYRCTKSHTSDGAIRGFLLQSRPVTHTFQQASFTSSGTDVFFNPNTPPFEVVDVDVYMIAGATITKNSTGESRTIVSADPITDPGHVVIDNPFALSLYNSTVTVSAKHSTFQRSVDLWSQDYLVNDYAFFYNAVDRNAGIWSKILLNNKATVTVKEILPPGTNRVEMYSPDSWELNDIGTSTAGELRPGFQIAHQTIFEYRDSHNLIVDFNTWYSEIFADRSNKTQVTQNNQGEYTSPYTNQPDPLTGEYVSSLAGTGTADSSAGGPAQLKYIANLAEHTGYAWKYYPPGMGETPLQIVKMIDTDGNAFYVRMIFIGQQDYAALIDPQASPGEHEEAKKYIRIIMSTPPHYVIYMKFEEEDMSSFVNKEMKANNVISYFTAEVGAKRAISCFQHEYEENEKKRNIKLIDRRYATQIMQELKSLLES
jgi:hypothetical protein